MQSKDQIKPISGPLNSGRSSPQNEGDLVSEEKALQGFWSVSENLRFTVFMDLNRSVFVSKGRRKSQRIFTRLSEYVNTRTARQCRSHFQKMMIKYHTISKLRSYFRKAVTPAVYDAEFQKIQESGSLLQEEIFPQLLPIRVKNYADKAVQTQRREQERQIAQKVPLNHEVGKNFSSAGTKEGQQVFFLTFPALNLFCNPFFT